MSCQRTIKPWYGYRKYVNNNNAGVNVNNLKEVDHIENITVKISQRPEQYKVGFRIDKSVLLPLSKADNLSVMNKKLTIGQLNCRSARNKGDSVSDEISDQEIDILAFTEKWFSENEDQAVLSSVITDGYSMLLKPATQSPLW